MSKENNIGTFIPKDSFNILNLINKNPSIEELKQAYAAAHNSGNRSGAALIWRAIQYAKGNEYLGEAFEVYVAKDILGNILYVGSGKNGRHLHCTSGKSHVLELNKMYFMGEEIVVEVVNTCKTKSESLRKEQTLIQELNPKFNKRRMT